MVSTLRLFIGLASLAYVVLAHDIGAVLARLRDVEARWLLAALVLVYAALLLRSLKWQSILSTYGQREPLGRLWALYVQSYFFNLLFPGNVAGDVSRVTRTSRHGPFSVLAMMAVVIERLSGLLTTAVFIVAAALLGGYRDLGHLGRPVIWLSVLVASVTGAVPFALRWLVLPTWGLSDSLRHRIDHSARQLRDASGLVISHPRLVWRLVALSLLFLAFSVATVCSIGAAIHSPIPVSLLVVYSPLIALIANLPISVAGLGVRENLYVAVYSALGFRPEDGLALALSESALLVIVGLSGGLLWWRPVRPSRRAASAEPQETA